MPSTGLGCALRRKGPGCALDCLLDAPWLGTRLGLSLGCALACCLDCFGAKRGGPGANRAKFFFGTSLLCLTGKKIPNVVGFGTFPNVVAFLSSRAVSRIEAALQGVLTAPSMEGALTAPCIGRPRLRLGLPLGRALAWDAPWVASWARLGLLLGLLCAGAGLGGIEPAAFFGSVVVLPNGKEDS